MSVNLWMHFVVKYLERSYFFLAFCERINLKFVVHIPPHVTYLMCFSTEFVWSLNCETSDFHPGVIYIPESVFQVKSQTSLILFLWWPPLPTLLAFNWVYEQNSFFTVFVTPVMIKIMFNSALEKKQTFIAFHQQCWTCQWFNDVFSL